MAELNNTQLTQILMNQNETLQLLFKKKMPKTILKDLKPAVSFEDFIENIELLPVTKLLNIKLPNYYTAIIMHNLDKLSIKNYPFVCTDVKQKKFYYYSNGEWIQNKQFINCLQKTIFHLVIEKLMELKKKSNSSDESQMCMYHFFDVDKYPTDKLRDKILGEMAKVMPSIDDYEE